MMKFKNMIFGALAFIFVMSTPMAKGEVVRVTFLGNSGVGKTCLIQRITTGSYFDPRWTTVGAANNLLLGTNVNLDIWDTAGLERYKLLSLCHARRSKVVVIVFSVADSDSFGATNYWLHSLGNYVNLKDTKFILVANKVDLVVGALEPFMKNTGKKAEDLGGMPYYLCSAKNGFGVDELKKKIFEIAVACSLETEELHGDLETVELHEDRKCC
ncbi:MAG: GTP-binding protein [Oscillospiraceae bacterium]|jgi:small GTP-binding protein|nr:GTP-binding protein [Oscillospiraceae bacterium]